jgi:hypothetical protein
MANNNEEDTVPLSDTQKDGATNYKDGILNRRFELWKTLLAVGIPALATIIVTIVATTNERADDNFNCHEVNSIENRLDISIVKCLQKIDGARINDVNYLLGVDSVLRLSAELRFRILPSFKLACRKGDVFSGNDLRTLQMQTFSIETFLNK